MSLFRHARRCAAIALLALSLGTPALAQPALWVVKHADTTIYLFGTVHLLPNDTDWRFPALERALADSTSLTIELTDDDDAVHMQALVLRYGLDPAHPLSNKLTTTDNATLAQAAEAVGVPGGAPALQVMRPWLAALTLALTPLFKAGLDPPRGVDTLLNEQMLKPGTPAHGLPVAPSFKAGIDPTRGIDKLLKEQMLRAGKPVHGLETAEQQIRFLADMPPAVELAFLRSTLRNIDQGGIEFSTLIDAWKTGDTATVARLEDETLRQPYPRLYQRLVLKRNQAWAKQIAGMLQRPGNVFIAVGAAHLAGPDSVQVQLRKLGIDAVRQ